MSAWPFNSEESKESQEKISSILEDYFTLLNQLEIDNSVIRKYINEEIMKYSDSNGKWKAECDDSSNTGSDTNERNISSTNLSFLSDSNQKLEVSNRLDKLKVSPFSSYVNLNSLSTVHSESSESVASKNINENSSRIISENVDSLNSNSIVISEQENNKQRFKDLNSSSIDKLLDEKENLLIELSSRQNANLLDFICLGFFLEPTNNKLGQVTYKKVLNIDYLVDKLSSDIEKLGDSYIDENVSTEQKKFIDEANVIADLFSLDSWLIIEALFTNNAECKTLDKIWSIIDNKLINIEESPASRIFLKVNSNFLLTRQQYYLEYLRKNNNLVDQFLRHVDSSMLMDFFLQCISTDTSESPNGFLRCLASQKLIEKLLDIIEDGNNFTYIKSSAGDVLKALIAISANTQVHEMTIGPNILTRKLVSPPMVERIINIILQKRGCSLNVLIGVVIELIRKNNHDYDHLDLLNETLETAPPHDRDPIFLGYLLKRFSEKLPNILQIMIDIENDTEIPFLENQLGQKFKALGFERFKIIELFAELLHCSNMGILNSKRAMDMAIQRDQFRENQKAETEGINMTEDDDAESFEIPYVNEEKNNQLRENPTPGDSFKISFYDLNIPSRLMQLFLKYPFNNFCHNVVFDVIQQIFNGRMDFSYNSFLVYSLFDTTKADTFSNQNLNSEETNNNSHEFSFQILTDFILKGYKNSYEFYEEVNTNLGYMGHLVLIAEEIVKFSKLYKTELISPDIHNKLQDEDWLNYSNEVLTETRVMYSKILSGGAFVEDENGNIIPQLSDGENISDPSSDSDNNIEDDKQSLGLTSEIQLEREKSCRVDDLEKELNYSTESDLHERLKNLLIKKTQKEVDQRNAKNGVIVLGPPE